MEDGKTDCGFVCSNTQSTPISHGEEKLDVKDKAFDLLVSIDSDP